MLGEGLTDNINGSIDTAEKTFSISFSKAKAEFCLSLNYNGNNSCLLTEKTSVSLKLMIIKISTIEFNFL